MSAQSLLHKSLALAFSLAVTGVALADTERVGYRHAFESSVCAPVPQPALASYRDAYARHGEHATSATASRFTGGYRDAYARLTAPRVERQVASVTATLSCVH